MIPSLFKAYPMANKTPPINKIGMFAAIKLGRALAKSMSVAEEDLDLSEP